ncbi:MAG: RpoL/Rpb11 RNA polymerase subunit family protein [Promethearchaeota archaeon]
MSEKDNDDNLDLEENDDENSGESQVVSSIYVDEREVEAREKKLIYIKSNVEITNNEANITITDESHGFCNAIKRYLLKNEHVLFASYKKQFYEDPTLFINTDGEVTALNALISASNKLKEDLVEIEKLFDAAVKKFGK